MQSDQGLSWVEWVQVFVVVGMAPFFLFPDISYESIINDKVHSTKYCNLFFYCDALLFGTNQ